MCPEGGALAGRLLCKWGVVRELSKAEEPVDRLLTVTVVGSDLCACGIHIVWGGYRLDLRREAVGCGFE